MPKLTREVYPVPNGGWASKLEGTARASARFAYKKEAIEYSRKRAKLENSKVRILTRTNRPQADKPVNSINNNRSWSLPGKQTIISFNYDAN